MFKSGALAVDLVRRLVTVEGQEVKLVPPSGVQYLCIHIRTPSQTTESDRNSPGSSSPGRASAGGCARPVNRKVADGVPPAYGIEKSGFKGNYDSRANHLGGFR